MENSNVEVRFNLRSGTRLPMPASEATFANCTDIHKAIPRVVRVLALAIYFDDLLRSGEAKNYSDLARLACVSRERISQIMKLLLLAPNIQRQVLALPHGRSTPMSETRLRQLAQEARWSEQCRLWAEFAGSGIPGR